MPTISPTHKQLNLTLPADVLKLARKRVEKAGSSITWEIEKHLHTLAGLPVPESPRRRGRPSTQK